MTREGFNATTAAQVEEDRAALAAGQPIFWCCDIHTDGLSVTGVAKEAAGLAVLAAAKLSDRGAGRVLVVSAALQAGTDVLRVLLEARS